jgi:hypothetical protein
MRNQINGRLESFVTGKRQAVETGTVRTTLARRPALRQWMR